MRVIRPGGGNQARGEKPMSELLISSEAHQQEVIGQPGEVTWIDRALLSNNTDLTLHRRPRCPGLRYVDHQWELFNRDADHSVYIAPYFADKPRTFRNVRRRASPGDAGGQVRVRAGALGARARPLADQRGPVGGPPDAGHRGDPARRPGGGHPHRVQPRADHPDAAAGPGRGPRPGSAARRGPTPWRGPGTTWPARDRAAGHRVLLPGLHPEPVRPRIRRADRPADRADYRGRGGPEPAQRQLGV